MVEKYKGVLGCVVIYDSCGVEKEMGPRFIQCCNESKIMILASLQIRYTITSAHIHSAGVCELAGAAEARKVHGEIAIPSCQPDLQVSRCTSAWPFVKN